MKSSTSSSISRATSKDVLMMLPGVRLVGILVVVGQGLWSHENRKQSIGVLAFILPILMALAVPLNHGAPLSLAWRLAFLAALGTSLLVPTTLALTARAGWSRRVAYAAGLCVLWLGEIYLILVLLLSLASGSHSH